MANKYWVHGTGNWSDNTNHWADSSGGSEGADLPTSSDDVYFDTNSGLSGETITITAPGQVQCRNFISTTGVSYTLNSTTDNIDVYGSLTLESGITTTGYLCFNFWATTPGHTITINNATLDGDINFEGVGGIWTLQDDLLTTGKIIQENGTFDANDHNITAGTIDIESWQEENISTVYMGSGTWECKFFNNYSLPYGTEFCATIYPETSTIKLSNLSGLASSPYFNGAGFTYNNVWLTELGTDGNPIEFDGYYDNYAISNTFNNIKLEPGVTVSFGQNATNYLSSLTAIGTVTNPIVFTSHYVSGDAGLTQSILSSSSEIIDCDYLNLSNSNVIGGATWYAGSHSDNTTNNNGWLFTSGKCPFPTFHK